MLAEFFSYYLSQEFIEDWENAFGLMQIEDMEIKVIKSDGAYRRTTSYLSAIKSDRRNRVSLHET